MLPVTDLAQTSTAQSSCKTQGISSSMLMAAAANDERSSMNKSRVESVLSAKSKKRCGVP